MVPVTTMLAAAFLILSGSLFANPATAHSYSEGQVIIAHPWSRPTPPGTPTGVGYMAITNNGEQPITLISAATPAASRVTIHRSRMENGLMGMEHLADGLVIPAGETVELKPRSYHLMLERLEAPLEEGQRIPLTLTFKDLEDIQVDLVVEGLAGVRDGAHETHGSGH